MVGLDVSPLTEECVDVTAKRATRQQLARDVVRPKDSDRDHEAVLSLSFVPPILLTSATVLLRFRQCR